VSFEVVLLRYVNVPMSVNVHPSIRTVALSVTTKLPRETVPNDEIDMDVKLTFEEALRTSIRLKFAVTNCVF
jgi:hypothetical protein